MKKTIGQNSDGGTEISFGSHVVTVQLSVNTAPPDAPANTVGGDALTTWMKLDDNKWIVGFDNNHMKTVERIMSMKAADILTYFSITKLSTK